MGNTASIASSNKKYLQKYLVNSILLQDINTIKTQKIIRKEFINYVKSGIWYNKLLAFEDNCYNTISSNNVDTLSTSELFSKCGYFVPGVSKVESVESIFRTPSIAIVQTFSAGLDSFDFADSSYPCIECENGDFDADAPKSLAEANTTLFTDEQIISFLIAVLYRSYHLDKEFLNIKKTANTCTVYNLMKKKTSQWDKKILPLRDIFLVAAAFTSEDQFDQYLCSEIWLDNYLSAIESSPLGVTIAEVDNIRNEQPIVYANKSFRALTGESLRSKQVLDDKPGLFRTVVNCNTHDTAAKAVRTALQLGKGVRVCVTTPTELNTECSDSSAYSSGRYSKCGDIHFVNMMSIKPVSDSDSNIRLLIGVHADASNIDKDNGTHSNIVSYLNSIDAILSVLPCVVNVPTDN